MALESLTLRQFWALFRKNWIVLSRHKLLNLLRCFILPIAYGIFLAVAQVFLIKPNHYGLGVPAPILPLADVFDPSLSFIWADGTNTPSNIHPSPRDVMNLFVQSLKPEHRSAVREVDSPEEIPAACPQNYNLFSECFAAVAFHNFPAPSNATASGPAEGFELLDPLAPPNGTDVLPRASLLNYTIRADAGLAFIDVIGHQSDFERRILPVQWAIDSAIIQLQTGSSIPQPTPLEWPFSMETDEEQALRTRLSYIRGLRSLLVLALFINFLGVSYHLPGSYVTERTSGLTPHLRAMGLRDLPRVLSWHISISLAYFPAWIITAVLWRYRIFSGTSVGIMIVVHLVTGLSLASYTFIVALPPLPPSLSAATSTFLAVILAILALVMGEASTGAAAIFVLIFPPSFFVFAVRAMAGFEVHQIPTSVIRGDPDHGLVLLPLILLALLTVFLYPLLAVYLERRFYDAHDPSQTSQTHFWSKSRRRSRSPAPERGTVLSPDTENMAIIVRHLSKSFRTSLLPSFLRPSHWFPFLTKRKYKDKEVTAIADLSLSIPRGGIFVLVGSNGAGKSTALGILAGLIGRSSGDVVFPAPRRHSAENSTGGTAPRSWRPRMGIVPQKNVLFPELTCHQTLRLWSDIKRQRGEGRERLDSLLEDCGLGGKGDHNAGSLSGGQKRKLQLAIGLVGGSEIVLVDECTSGVDPLSRRAIWKTLTGVKDERTIVFTTHFLDEADLLADNIAVLAAPGKLVADGSPVKLKSTLGQGYTINVTFVPDEKMTGIELLTAIQRHAPGAAISSSSPNGVAYSLHSKDSKVVKQVLETLQEDTGISSYDVHGTSIEDIFLELMQEESEIPGPDVKPEHEKHTPVSSTSSTTEGKLDLTPGRHRSPLSQSLTIFHKRWLIARRSWLAPLLAVAVAVFGSCIPLFFLSDRAETCTPLFRPAPRVPLYLGDSPYSSLLSVLTGGRAIVSPAGLVDTLGPSAAAVSVVKVTNNETFVGMIQQEYRNVSLGGVSIDMSTGQSLIAWEGSPPGLTSPTLLNLASNVLYNRALNASGRADSPNIIAAGYQSFPAMDAGTLFALKWIAFFGATMGAFPAFFAMYVARERRSSVQAMQLSNGLTNPAGLWLGHLLFDGIFCIILSTIIIIVFAAVSKQFHGLGYFWVVLVLYGFAATLFAYCVSLFTASALAAFAAVAGYGVIMFVLYIAGYLLTITYAKNSRAAGIITIIHFTVSLASPVASVLRAALVSVNLFSLLCSNGEFSPSSMGNIMKYGGPIVYLIGDCLFLFAFLVYVDSGSVLPRWMQLTRPPSRDSRTPDAPVDIAPDVSEETQAVEISSTDPLRVLHVSKSFDGSTVKAVDDVSFGVSQDTVFAMLGPNGAGKTSTFNIIRGDIYPDYGDVYINGTSIIAHPNTARLSLGVCPQFTAIDTQLTVREHLEVYGLLKGLRKGNELRQDVEALLHATTLSPYADRLASKLSGGNQRKLSFAIALIGNPTVILIDEYSTGIDAATKRSMWKTFRRMAVGKAVVITTHSMEEASALASKVGILAGRMLAVGSTESLASRYATYEVHFPARTRSEVVLAQQLMSRIPGSRMADDVATRFEVPIIRNHTPDNEEDGEAFPDSSLSLAQLFDTLSAQQDFPEYTVERVSLESVFLKVIREHNIQEEDTQRRRKRRNRLRCC